MYWFYPSQVGQYQYNAMACKSHHESIDLRSLEAKPGHIELGDLSRAQNNFLTECGQDTPRRCFSTAAS